MASMMECRRRLVMNTPHIETASGSSITLNAERAKLKRCAVNFSLVQSGSGNASPSNVRPITGWTGLDVYRSGANTANADTFAADWQTVAGTLYGGHIDLVSGEISSDWVYIEATPEGMPSLEKDSENSSVVTYYFGRGNNNLPVWQANTMISNMFCNQNSETWKLEPYSWGTYFKIAKSELSSYDVAGGRAWLDGHPTVFCVRVNTSNAYHVAPQVINTVSGENHIWSNANGNIELSYWTH